MKKMKLLMPILGVTALAGSIPAIASCSCNNSGTTTREVDIDTSVSSDVTITTNTTSEGDLEITITPKSESKDVSSVTVKIGDVTLSTSEYTYTKSTHKLVITKAILDKYQGKIVIKPIIEEEPQVEWETAFDDVNIVGNPDANVTMEITEQESNYSSTLKFADKKLYVTDIDEGETNNYFYVNKYNVWFELDAETGSNDTQYHYALPDEGAYASWYPVYLIKMSTNHTYDSENQCYKGTIDLYESTLPYKVFFNTSGKPDHIEIEYQSNEATVITFTNVGETTITETFPTNIKDNLLVADSQGNKTWSKTITFNQDDRYVIVFEQPSITAKNTITLIDITSSSLNHYSQFMQSDIMVDVEGTSTANSFAFAAGVITKQPLVCDVYVTGSGTSPVSITVQLVTE